MSKANKKIFFRARSIHRTGSVFWGWYVVFSSFVMLTLIYGARYSFFSTGIGGALGPILGGFIFDKTGSYRPGWIMNTVFLLIISLLILALKPKPKEG